LNFIRKFVNTPQLAEGMKRGGDGWQRSLSPLNASQLAGGFFTNREDFQEMGVRKNNLIPGIYRRKLGCTRYSVRLEGRR
jgi:hypothetical protein